MLTLLSRCPPFLVVGCTTAGDHHAGCCTTRSVVTISLEVPSSVLLLTRGKVRGMSAVLSIHSPGHDTNSVRRPAARHAFGSHSSDNSIPRRGQNCFELIGECEPRSCHDHDKAGEGSPSRRVTNHQNDFSPNCGGRQISRSRSETAEHSPAATRRHPLLTPRATPRPTESQAIRSQVSTSGDGFVCPPNGHKWSRTAGEQGRNPCFSATIYRRNSR